MGSAAAAAIQAGTGNPSLQTVVAAANAAGLRLGTLDG